MTAKEKAEELFNKYCFAIATEITDDGFFTNTKQAKKCATIAVDEIIKSNPTYQSSNPFLGTRTYDNVSYWEQVKQEIELITLIF